MNSVFDTQQKLKSILQDLDGFAELLDELADDMFFMSVIFNITDIQIEFFEKSREMHLSQMVNFLAKKFAEKEPQENLLEVKEVVIKTVTKVAEVIQDLRDEFEIADNPTTTNQTVNQAVNNYRNQE